MQVDNPLVDTRQFSEPFVLKKQKGTWNDGTGNGPYGKYLVGFYQLDENGNTMEGDGPYWSRDCFTRWGAERLKKRILDKRALERLPVESI